MADNPEPAAPLEEVIAASGIPVPNPTPHNITVAMVAWNEAERLPALLERVRPYFQEIAIVVQKSTDGTEDIAREAADIFTTDDHRGYGDASFGPKLLPLVRTSWTLKLDCDEWPSDDLLTSLTSAAWWANKHSRYGVWIPFRSAIDGVEWDQPHSHLRLFRTTLGWPSTLHSRPMLGDGDTFWWHTGHIRHDRSLDEMIRDYLSYYAIGRDSYQWERHNREMMYHACSGTAEAKGWDYVKSFPWWPQVRAIAFPEEPE